VICVKFKVSIGSRREGRRLTWVLLISARFPTSAAWLAKDRSRNAAFPPLPDPPITDTPQENLGGAPPADLLTRCGWVGINTSGHPVDLGEELLVEQRCELFGGVLDVLNDLGKGLGGFLADCTRNGYFLVNLLRGHTVLSQIIKKDVDFNGVPLEAFVDVSGLDQISEIGKAVQVLRTE
jgi:hypothetical protein